MPLRAVSARSKEGSAQSQPSSTKRAVVASMGGLLQRTHSIARTACIPCEYSMQSLQARVVLFEEYTTHSTHLQHGSPPAHRHLGRLHPCPCQKAALYWPPERVDRDDEEEVHA
eukprot:scaffold8988_cov14-Tisochrysis_lutea.AAC.1